MATLRALADQLKLSVATVSRALDGYPDVAAATRERVRAAADAAGYRPNAAARRLRRGRTDVVAVVLPADPGCIGEPLYLELFAVLGARLAEAGLDLIVQAARPGAEEDRLYRRLIEERRADGVLVVRTRRHDPRVERLAAAGLPFVAMGRTESACHAFVDGDGEAGFRAAVARLAALGHRGIAHVAAPPDLMFAHLRARGWRAGLRDAGATGDSATGSPDEAGGHAAARALLPARPTALLCATDRMAIGAMRAVRQAGLRPGTDIAIIGHDDIPAAAWADPPLATLVLPIADTAGRLADALLARIGGADPRDWQHVSPLDFVPRASLGAPISGRDTP
jgi:LacI family transcriptional regulator